MYILKVGKQSARFSDQDLNKLLVYVFGNTAKYVMDRMIKQLPVIKHGKNWEIK